MERRWERCRLVVENSLQIGEWDKHPGDPLADPGGPVGRQFRSPGGSVLMSAPGALALCAYFSLARFRGN
jgi:hypothetical protein